MTKPSNIITPLGHDVKTEKKEKTDNNYASVGYFPQAKTEEQTGCHDYPYTPHHPRRIRPGDKSIEV